MLTRGPLANRRWLSCTLHRGWATASGMLHNAAVGHSPVVVYVGQGDSRTMFQQPHLSGDLVSMARPVTKWAYEMNHAVDLPHAMRRAYKIANEPPQGPVVLSIPVDTMDQEAEVRIEPTQHTKWRVGADPEGIAEAAEMLSGSRKPMLLVGDQVAFRERKSWWASWRSSSAHRSIRATHGGERPCRDIDS